MGVPISNVPRRVVYAASGTGPYAFTFEILANTDIAVYKDDTLLTLTTDYTVTIAGNGTGSITLVASPTGATQIAIVGNRTIKRLSDFVTGGDFFANTVNDELDQQTIFAQQNAEGLGRALQAPQTDPTSINMTLPRATLRAGKVLAFDADGNPTLGDTLGTNRGNWAAGVLYYVRDIVKDTTNSNIYQCVTQHTSTGALPISSNTDTAKWFKMVDAAAAATSASAAATSATAASSSASAASTSASSASTAKTAAETAQTAAEAARDQTLAVYDSFDDRYLGSKTSDPTVDNDGNALVAGTIYFNSSSGIMKLYTGSAWVAAYVQGVASGIGFTPTGGVAATTVQAAIVEVDSEKLAKASNLSDLASASTARTNLGLAIGTDVQAYSAQLQGASQVGINGFKNRIINGDCRIDQRFSGASKSITDTSNVTYVLDRFWAYASQASKVSGRQNPGSVTPPAGFKNYFGVTVDATATIGAGDSFTLGQTIEGFNVADLGFGAAGASSVTLSFWVRSSNTGTFGGSLRNGAVNRCYVFTYSISAANTWEYKTITIAGDTSGTWYTDNGIGILLTLGIGQGSSNTTTAGSWGAGNYTNATGATSLLGTIGNYMYVTGVQLEAGSTATAFDRRPYGTELALCQRYGQINPAVDLEINALTTTTNLANINLTVTMRTSPSVTTQPTFTLSGTTSNSLAGLSASTVLFSALPSANGYIRIRCSSSGFLSAEL